MFHCQTDCENTKNLAYLDQIKIKNFTWNNSWNFFVLLREDLRDISWKKNLPQRRTKFNTKAREGKICTSIVNNVSIVVKNF